jgi:DNA-binding CsgD family transcriptional regulator
MSAAGDGGAPSLASSEGRARAVESRALAKASPSRANEVPVSAFAARLQQQHARTLAEALQMIGLAAAVLDAAGEMLAANRLFAALVPGVVRQLRGRPRLTDAAADRLIEDTLARPDAWSLAGAVRSIAIRGHDGKPPAIVQLIPLRGAAGDVFAGAAGILIVTPVRPRPAPSPRVLQRLFGLSPAEARVASGLGARQTVTAMADDFGVSRETVRSQLKVVLAKTGTQRQVDLAVLLARLPQLLIV